MKPDNDFSEIVKLMIGALAILEKRTESIRKLDNISMIKLSESEKYELDLYLDLIGDQSTTVMRLIGRITTILTRDIKHIIEIMERLND